MTCTLALLHNFFSPAPDSPDFLGEYTVAPMTDYEEQIRSNNHIRNTVINTMRRNICYNQTIYNDMRLEVSEYVGLTLAVRDSSVRTEIQPEYDQVAIQILDDDSKLHFVVHIHCMYILTKSVILEGNKQNSVIHV